MIVLLDLLATADLPALIEPVRSPNTALFAWGVIFLIVAGYELWAISTRHQTLSQGVQRGPRWFKWSIGIGFGVLAGHIFLQK